MTSLPPATSRPRQALRALARGLLGGSHCAVCERWQDATLCAACHGRWAAPRWRCRLCALPLPEGSGEVCGRCLREPPRWDAAIAALDYAFPWPGLIARCKFQAAPELAAPLAGLLAQAILRERAAGWLGTVDLVLPVPLSTQRLRERGYNQGWELARVLARTLGHGAAPGLIERVRDTPHQVALPRAERLHNLAAAFALTPAGRARVAGARVALVDDVMTTGATLQEVAATLTRAGAAELQVWVVARTPET